MVLGISKIRSSGVWDGTEFCLDLVDLCRLWSLCSLFGLEFNSISLTQRAESLTRDRGVMDEYVFATIVGCDETESFGVVEPLHRSLHLALLTQHMILRTFARCRLPSPTNWHASPGQCCFEAKTTDTRPQPPKKRNELDHQLCQGETRTTEQSNGVPVNLGR
jgi:hypothetical protein